MPRPSLASMLKRLFVGADSFVPLRPIHILAVLIVVALMLVGITFLSPSNSIKLPMGFTLRLPEVKELLTFGVQPSSEIASDSLFEVAPVEQSVQVRLPANCTPDDVRALPIQPVEYPKGHEDALMSIMLELAMQKFGESDVVRVLHYGDSQLETDRVTSYLRKQLQEKFGGGGVGYIPLNPQIPINPTVKLSISDDWICSQPLVTSRSALPLRMGHLLSSAKCNISADNNPWIKIERRALKSFPPLRFNRLNLLMSSADSLAHLEVRTPTRLIHDEAIQASDGMQLLSIKIPDTRESVTLSFRGNGSVEVYSLGLDNQEGVAVDNVSLRSSAGIDFCKVDAEFFKSSCEYADVKLVILQFGVNVVPKISNSYSYYEEQLYEQLMFIKRLLPKADVLVVGVSDMAQRSNGVLESYPNIESVRDAQRQAVFKAGCAFWDTYTAMGGKNAIVSWAYAKPTLASKDFCHFTSLGATLLAELLYRSLDVEYNKFCKIYGLNNAPTAMAEDSVGITK